MSRKPQKPIIPPSRPQSVPKAPDPAGWLQRYFDRITHKSTPIVPVENVIGRALVLVTAIMCFLACLALGTAWAVHRASIAWTSEAASELTLQIKPVDGLDMADEINKAMRHLGTVSGVVRAEPISNEETRKLLEPWLGADLDFDDLPVPQLITVEIDRRNPPNLQVLASELIAIVPGARLDDHRVWQNQVRSAANWIKWTSFLVLILMLGATIAIIVFATRAAMSSNRDVVNVLHLVGARDRFIVREFERHFLVLGLKGGLAGGFLAATAFIVARYALEQVAPRSLDGEFNSLIHAVSIGWSGFAAIAGIVAFLAILTSLTSRYTVFRYLKSVE
ncbi:MAG: ABC transporter permease [Rhizobiales bacterium]|nr:ABC transporter permease [Hyphomicrobiales bacterium]